jgi:hypothetical protein
VRGLPDTNVIIDATGPVRSIDRKIIRTDNEGLSGIIDTNIAYHYGCCDWPQRTFSQNVRGVIIRRLST